MGKILKDHCYFKSCSYCCRGCIVLWMHVVEGMGLTFSDLMYVTKRNMANAVSNLTKHLESVFQTWMENSTSKWKYQS
ncbi:hypothetical protein CsSME_00048125 [Camellia sinensis var. sinensis]